MKKKALLTGLLLTCFFSFFYCYHGLKYYFQYGLLNYDFGVHFESLVRVQQGGSWFLTGRGLHLLAEYQKYLQVLLGFAIDHQVPFIIFHSLCLTTPILLLYLILKKQPWTALTLSLFYILHPTTLNMNEDLIHIEAALIPLVLLNFYCLLHGKKVLLILSFILACLCREDTGIFMALLATVYFLFARYRILPIQFSQSQTTVLASFALGLVAFNFLFVGKYFRIDSCLHLGQDSFTFANIGRPNSILSTFESAPNKIKFLFEKVTSKDYAFHFAWMLLPLVFVGPKFLLSVIPATPTLLALAAASAPYFFNGYFHYDYAVMISVLLAVSAFTLTNPKKYRLLLLQFGLVCISIAFHVQKPIQLRTPLEAYFKVRTWEPVLRAKVSFLEELDLLIPSTQSVSADYVSMNYLMRSGRDIYMWSNPFQAAYFGVFAQCNRSPELASDWVILRSDYPGEPELIQSLEAGYQKYENRVLGFFIYARKNLELSDQLKSILSQ